MMRETSAMPTLQLPAYTPALYLPGHYGRYRTYPFDTTTPIPGAGYDARLQWGEQVLNLDGAPAGQHFRYGDYRRGGGVPLLGMGNYLGQTTPAAPAPMTGSVFSRFGQTASSLWMGGAQVPYGQLAEYAKITAVGTFVGIPVAVGLSAWLMHRSMKKKAMRSNRSRRRR